MDPLTEFIVPTVVPHLFVSLYPTLILVAITTAVIGFIGVLIEKIDLQKILVIQIVYFAMLVIVASVGTDLAEALILPGMVVSLAELLAVSEILISREYTRRSKNGQTPEIVKPSYVRIKMEVLDTALPVTSIIFVIYGAILTGFTGGAVAGAGILIYLFARQARGMSSHFWEEMAGISGIAWVFWLLGFLLFFLDSSLWLIALFMSGCGIIVKVGLKLGLLGILGREEINK
jgi:energy-converting hydrogenase A subunit G